MQAASTILLIKPKSFGFNPDTAVNNTFQKKPEGPEEQITEQAVKEFEDFASTLKSNGVNVLVFEDTTFPAKPDAVFPNNWISFHPDGTVVLYPMFAPLRRAERRMDIIESLRKRYYIKRIIDLTHYEKENKFLEGTGSIVFDHMAKVAYACVSPRTDPLLLRELCEKIGYREILFHAFDQGKMPVYHTNVMMCVAEKFAVVCLESIQNSHDRHLVESALEIGGHEVIPISISQVAHFAGNMLAVKSGQKQLLVMSSSAYNILTLEQKQQLERYCELLPISIRTIETVGGGSARCMMAEIFLPSVS